MTTLQPSSLATSLAAPRAAPVGLHRVHTVATPLLDRLVLFYSAVWLLFVITGFRMPWEPIPTGDDDPNSLRRQVVFTIGASLALHRLIRHGTFGRRIGWHFGFVLIAIFLVGTLAYTDSHVLTLKRSMVHVFGLMMLLSVVDAHPRPVTFYLKVLVGVVGSCAIVSIGSYYVFPAECTTVPFRPGLAGVTGHPNVLGPTLQVGLLASLALKPNVTHRRLVLWGMQLAMAIALWMTDSVTSLMSTLFGGFIYVALTTTSYRAGLIQLGLIGSLFIASFVGLDNLHSGFFKATGRDESLSGRDELWQLVYQKGLDHPLFGNGYGAFWYEGRGRELVLTWDPRQAHHAWIDVFVDLGLIGLFVVILVIPFRLLPLWQRARGRRGTMQRKAAAAILATTLALLIVTSWSESFLLKNDKLQFFAMLWGLMLMENLGPNRFGEEFHEERMPKPRKKRQPVARAASPTPQPTG